MQETLPKGLSVSSDIRNTKVVALLIASMTVGAVALLWLEPPTPGWSSATLLMAESAHRIDEVRVEFVGPEAEPDPATYDCAILPSGDCTWKPRGAQIRLLVLASDEPKLPRSQAEMLLAVFGSLTHRHGLNLDRVWLHPASDARLHPELPAQAHDLCDLLVRKGIVP